MTFSYESKGSSSIANLYRSFPRQICHTVLVPALATRCSPAFVVDIFEPFECLRPQCLSAWIWRGCPGGYPACQCFFRRGLLSNSSSDHILTEKSVPKAGVHQRFRPRGQCPPWV